MLSINHHPSFIPHHSLPKTRIAGRIHTVEPHKTTDGPGCRYVIATQGCPLRCLYCCYPDYREICGGQKKTVDELVSDMQAYYANNQSSHKQMTITGGEPLLQPEFVAELLRQCQNLGIHTALDTSGYANLHSAKYVVQYADLVLLDIKAFAPELYRHVTSVSLEPTLQLAQYLSNVNKPTWIRFVVVPGLTDSKENVESLANFIASLTNIQRVEVIPFRPLDSANEKQLNDISTLKNTPQPSDDLMERVRQQFGYQGLPVV